MKLKYKPINFVQLHSYINHKNHDTISKGHLVCQECLPQKEYLELCLLNLMNTYVSLTRHQCEYQLTPYCMSICTSRVPTLWLAAVSAWFGLVTLAFYTLGALSTCSILLLENVEVAMLLKQCTCLGILKAR
jgi:hypothetical protein